MYYSSDKFSDMNEMKENCFCCFVVVLLRIKGYLKGYYKKKYIYI